MSYKEYDDPEQQTRERRKRRLEQMRKDQEQQRRRRKLLRFALFPGSLIVIVLVVGVRFAGFMSQRHAQALQEQAALEQQQAEEEAAAQQAALEETARLEQEKLEAQAAAEEEERKNKVYSATATTNTTGISSEVISEHAIVVDMDKGTIVAQRDPKSRISPASMTKILTVLVAAENITEDQLDDLQTVTIEDTDYAYSNDCSAVGFDVDETVPVRDLFYGTILSSGADAASALARYVAGSQDAFVELMNEKLETMELSDTAHFTNAVGIYNEDHYCTTYDMAMIMEAAMNNEFVKEVMSAHIYTTASTTQHPDGIEISNWFLRRIEDKDCGGTVVAAKTGFVVQSKNCAASYAEDESGKHYICVTAGSSSSWRCIYDHVAIYKALFSGDTAWGAETDETEVEEAENADEGEEESME